MKVFGQYYIVLHCHFIEAPNSFIIIIIIIIILIIIIIVIIIIIIITVTIGAIVTISVIIIIKVIVNLSSLFQPFPAFVSPFQSVPTYF